MIAVKPAEKRRSTQMRAVKLRKSCGEALQKRLISVRRSAAKCGEIKERSKEKRAGAPAGAGAGARSKPRAKQEAKSCQG